jgi:adenylate cyclase
MSTSAGDRPGLAGELEATLVGEPRLTRRQVAERSGVPLELAEQLWQQLGFPHVDDDVVAFTEADVRALRRTAALIDRGVLTPDSQAALVRTWARSFARLAEWQVRLLADVALDSTDPAGRLRGLTEEVLPDVAALQDFVWRRHLASSATRLIEGLTPEGDAVPQTVCFVDIVGFTSRSKRLSDHELVTWVETFEEHLAAAVTDHGGRLIKTIGDEVLFVTDAPGDAVGVALSAAARGADRDDPFPSVRAGAASGEVVSRLGDVLGPTVNLASRLTSLARPDTVVVDRATRDALADVDGLRFRRMRRTSVKGYARLEPWVARQSPGSG